MTNNLRSKSNISAAILFFSIAITGVVSSAGQSGPVMAEQINAVDTPMKAKSLDTEAIERTVRDYLLKNPGVIREAQIALQAQEQKEREDRTAKTVQNHRREIFSDPGSPSSGNLLGDVSIVVFFDYNCGYCKKTLPHLQALSQKDALVRLVFKELPILGPQSFTAAKAALAAGRQGKYVEFHNALLSAENTTDGTIRSIAKTLGINYLRLEKDMADPRIEEQIRLNSNLAGLLGIDGTPAYVIGERIIPGAVDLDSLIRFVAIERRKPIDKLTTENRVVGSKQ